MFCQVLARCGGHDSGQSVKRGQGLRRCGAFHGVRATLLAMSAHHAVLECAGMLTAPESPVWLASKGRSAEAESAATHLWGPMAAAQLDTTAAGSSGKAAAVDPGHLKKKPYS